MLRVMDTFNESGGLVFLWEQGVIVFCVIVISVVGVEKCDVGLVCTCFFVHIIDVDYGDIARVCMCTCVTTAHARQHVQAVREEALMRFAARSRVWHV